MTTDEVLNTALVYLSTWQPRPEEVRLHPELAFKLSKAYDRMEHSRMESITRDDVILLVEAWIMGACEGQNPLIGGSDIRYARKPECQFWPLP